MINLTSPALRDVLDEHKQGRKKKKQSFVFLRHRPRGRNGLDTALCTDPKHGSQWCVSDGFYLHDNKSMG